jgi:hypothetical protein
MKTNEENKHMNPAQKTAPGATLEYQLDLWKTSHALIWSELKVIKSALGLGPVDLLSESDLVSIQEVRAALDLKLKAAKAEKKKDKNQPELTLPEKE